MGMVPPLPQASAPWAPPNQISSLELLEMLGMPAGDASIVAASSRATTRSRSRTSRASDAPQPQNRNTKTTPPTQEAPREAEQDEPPDSPPPSTHRYPSEPEEPEVSLPLVAET
eukprot:1666505-Amphidinium_carterae.1